MTRLGKTFLVGARACASKKAQQVLTNIKRVLFLGKNKKKKKKKKAEPDRER